MPVIDWLEEVRGFIKTEAYSKEGLQPMPVSCVEVPKPFAERLWSGADLLYDSNLDWVPVDARKAYIEALTERREEGVVISTADGKGVN